MWWKLWLFPGCGQFDTINTSGRYVSRANSQIFLSHPRSILFFDLNSAVLVHTFLSFAFVFLQFTGCVHLPIWFLRFSLISVLRPLNRAYQSKDDCFHKMVVQRALDTPRQTAQSYASKHTNRLTQGQLLLICLGFFRYPFLRAQMYNICCCFFLQCTW